MPPNHAATIAARGAFAAGASFLLWGLWPLYWRSMESVSAFELIAHRIVWSLLLLLLVMLAQRSLPQLWSAFRARRVLAGGLLSGVLLATNWTIYVWAVNNGHVIDSSLGYFLTPLLNVALGYLFLHERLRMPEWTAVGFAVAGVMVLLLRAAHLPWIALSLACSWSLYGVLKKQSSLGPIPGLALEALLLSPVAGTLLLWRIHSGQSAFAQANPELDVLVLASGVLTTAPLLLYAYGVRRIRLATVGLLQYIAPSVQFVLGLWLYNEPFDAPRLHACVLIWCGLAIYTADSFWSQRARFRPAANTANAA
ncbi:MAG: EamA family transporter RarD [Steroidobacteraceae bacterium]